MPITPTDPNAVDTSSIGYDPNDVSRLKLLELLNLQAQGKANTKASMLGDILKMQTEGKQAQADSYAPGVKYASGWEPGGLMDSLLAMGNGPGTSPVSMGNEDPQRLISRVDMEDPETLVTNALGIINRITGAEGEDNPVQKTLMDALVASLMPQKKGDTGGAGSTGGAATPFQADPRDIGGGTGAGMAGDIPFAGGQTDPRVQKANAQAKQGSSKNGGYGGPDPSAILDGLSNLMDSVHIPNPFGGLVGGPGGTSGSPNKSGAQAPVNPSAQGTQQMVEQIMQRASQQPAPNAGKNKKDWGANTPGSKHPTGYKDGSQVFEGHTLIRVGERPPGDKKYATEEVVYAAPGTVVAPVPRGMENPSEEEAAGLVFSQLLKSRKNPKMTGIGASKVGSLTTSASTDRTGAQNMAMFRDTFKQNKLQNERNFGLSERQFFTQRDQGNRGLDLQDQGQRLNYDLGLRNWGTSDRAERDQNALGQGRLNLDTELGRGNLDLGRQNLSLNFQRAQDEVRNWEAERALKRELGMRGLDIDKQRADQDYQLNSAQMAFQQIMAGISGSALPGVRAGRTPQLGLLG